VKTYKSKHFPQSTYQQVLKITFKTEMFANDSSNIYTNRSPFHINFVMYLTMSNAMKRQRFFNLKPTKLKICIQLKVQFLIFRIFAKTNLIYYILYINVSSSLFDVYSFKFKLKTFSK